MSLDLRQCTEDGYGRSAWRRLAERLCTEDVERRRTEGIEIVENILDGQSWLLGDFSLDVREIPVVNTCLPESTSRGLQYRNIKLVHKKTKTILSNLKRIYNNSSD